MSRVSSYLYMGASVQMAFTLGLHRDQLSELGSAIERELHRRIWWTLFLLDQEISSRGGTPNAIDERYAKITTPMVCEKVSSFCVNISHYMLTVPSCFPLVLSHPMDGYLYRSRSAGSSEKLSKQSTLNAPQTQYPCQQSRTRFFSSRNGIGNYPAIYNKIDTYSFRKNAQWPSSI